MKKPRYVIAGGGTGGHIYPGLALAESLKKSQPEAEIHFVGAEGGLEEKIVPSHGYPIHLLKVGRLHSSVGPWRQVKAALLLPYSFLQAIALYIVLRPRWVLGTGGFASGPFVLVASLLGGRTAILEPNAYPGMANRWLAKVVTYCFVVFDQTKDYFPEKKVVSAGLPVRMEKKTPHLDYSGQRPFRVLIFGGSQGSRAINHVVGDWVESLGDQASAYDIYHQIGARDFSIWKERYGDKYKDSLTYVEYIDDMPTQLDWADVIICRSGINSTVEVAMSSRPAIFIPLPTAADNHQVKNAQALSERGAAMMIEEKDLNAEMLGKTLQELKENPSRLMDMMNQLKDIDYSHAPKEILSILMGANE